MCWGSLGSSSLKDTASNRWPCYRGDTCQNSTWMEKLHRESVDVQHSKMGQSLFLPAVVKTHKALLIYTFRSGDSRVSHRSVTGRHLTLLSHSIKTADTPHAQYGAPPESLKQCWARTSTWRPGPRVLHWNMSLEPRSVSVSRFSVVTDQNYICSHLPTQMLTVPQNAQ